MKPIRAIIRLLSALFRALAGAYCGPDVRLPTRYRP